jgi:uncharacterized alpha-E superfamily protein
MRFLWLGAMLERVGQTARILDMHHHTMEREAAVFGSRAESPASAFGARSDPPASTHDIVQTALWMSLLRACSGSEAFMKKNQGRVTAHNLVEFLLLSRAFPRSLSYCLRSSLAILRQIWPDAEPRASVVGSPAEPRASTHRLEGLIEWLQREAEGEAFELAGIHRLLTHVVDETAAICGAVSEEILGPKPATKEPAAASVRAEAGHQLQSQG